MSLKKEIIEDSKAFVRTNRRLLIDFEERASQGYLSPRISSEFMDCSLPMTFDSYSHCHPAGTLIEMSGGTREQIENIKNGDIVLTYSVKQQEIVKSEVVNCFEREVNSIISIETEEGDILKLTDDHPVFVVNKGWVKAKYLEIDDTVLKIT